MASQTDRCRSRTDRAQSESIGVIILTAVVVILVGGFGVVYLGASDGGGGPLVDAEVNATADQIAITHAGGDGLAIDTLEVVLRADGDSERYAMDGANVIGDGDGTFEPGERYRRAHGLGSGPMEVLLVDADANAVVHQAHVDAG